MVLDISSESIFPRPYRNKMLHKDYETRVAVCSKGSSLRDSHGYVASKVSRPKGQFPPQVEGLRLTHDVLSPANSRAERV